MSDSFSKKADKYLKTNHQDLQTVYAKIKALDSLHRKISSYLDPHLRECCQVANLIGGRLILLVANGSVATQLRFQTPDLLNRFKQDKALQKIQEIHCKVRPPLTPFRSLPNEIKKMKLLSPETADMILTMADSLEHPKLREIMQRIAKHTKENKEK